MGAASRLEIRSRLNNDDATPAALEKLRQINQSLSAIEEIKVYKIESDQNIASLTPVFADPVLHEARADDAVYNFAGQTPTFAIEVSYRAGVTDNPARAAEEALAVTGVNARVASGSLYFLFGNLAAADAMDIARSHLANDLIQKADVLPYGEFLAARRFENTVLPKTILHHAATTTDISLELDDDALETLSRDKLLALSLREMHCIRDHYRTLQRNPTDVELEIIAQTWSEHCKHKIFGANISYTDKHGTVSKINSLYKTYIKRATEDVRKARGLDWLISVFSDNAGIVRFDKNIDLCIKVETHNSPSALDPFGGALTGILGVNRDILGAGLGARPIANSDVFCFAPPTMPQAGEESFMPDGPKSPRRILTGVHKGVEDGGNKSGIPTVNGAFFFDRDYAGKPLVFVGTLGIMPQVLPNGRPSAEKKLSAGDRIIMAGGAIGADGIHGATFSSQEMDENAPATAVQIGDPLTQKRLADFLLEARDLGLYAAITDNGAGGLSSSVGEMAQMSNGASIDLALCPVKYPGLAPWELMISESQERMTFAAPPQHVAALLQLAQRRGVVATDIGSFTDDGMLKAFYNGALVAQLDLAFLHDGLPPMELTAEWKSGKPRAPWHPQEFFAETRNLAPTSAIDALQALLQTPNITSKEKWVRAYDHEVQGATHVKPFTGKHADGPADAGGIWLYPHGGAKDNAVAFGCGLAPRMSPIDPYLMAQAAVDEAVRNVVATGGDPDMCCLLDNFCWPDPVVSAKNPDGAYKMGQLVEACRGLYDICLGYGMPLVSGKDSMKNDYRGKDMAGRRIDISILPTLMVTALSRMNIGTAAGSDFKTAGDIIYLLGDVAPQGLGGSEFANMFVANDVAPEMDIAKNIGLYRQIHTALNKNLLSSIHDVSEGGLLTALAESMIGGRLGAALSCDMSMEAWFHEAAGRFVVSVSPQNKSAFEGLFAHQATLLGMVVDAQTLSLADGSAAPLASLVTAWKKGF